MAEGQEALLTEAEETFHEPPTEKWFEHETSWFSFYVPEERHLGAWVFNYIRPNAGVSGGGVALWDDTGFFHFEVPYYRHYAAMPIPPNPDLRDITFPSGVSIKMLESFKRYHLGFNDSPRLTFDLEFDAVMKPWVDTPEGTPPVHFDQMGHVTGELVLHGKTIRVDSYGMRDRSWHRPRSDRWESPGVGAYTCAADATTALFVMGFGPKKKGFLMLDGERSGLVEGSRTIERDPDHGYVTKMRLAGTDALGRSFDTECECTSRIAMPIPGVSGICWNTLFRAEVDGHEIWGEDQDFWNTYEWSETRRRQRGIFP